MLSFRSGTAASTAIVLTLSSCAFFDDEDRSVTSFVSSLSECSTPGVVREAADPFADDRIGLLGDSLVTMTRRRGLVLHDVEGNGLAPLNQLELPFTPQRLIELDLAALAIGPRKVTPVDSFIQRTGSILAAFSADAEWTLRSSVEVRGHVRQAILREADSELILISSSPGLSPAFVIGVTDVHLTRVDLSDQLSPRVVEELTLSLLQEPTLSTTENAVFVMDSGETETVASVIPFDQGSFEMTTSFAISGSVLNESDLDHDGDVLRCLAALPDEPSRFSLQTFDVQLPDSVTPLGQLNLTLLETAERRIVYHGDSAVLLEGEMSGTARLLDLSDPLVPRLAGGLSVGGRLVHAQFHGDAMIGSWNSVATEGEHALALFDVADLDAPGTLSELALAGQLRSRFELLDEALIASPVTRMESTPDGPVAADDQLAVVRWQRAGDSLELAGTLGLASDHVDALALDGEVVVLSGEELVLARDDGTEFEIVERRAMSRYVRGLERCGEFIVSLVGERDAAVSLSVFSDSDPGAFDAEATLDLALRNAAMVRIDESTVAVIGASIGQSSETTAIVIDVREPRQPAVRGELSIAARSGHVGARGLPTSFGCAEHDVELVDGGGRRSVYQLGDAIVLVGRLEDGGYALDVIDVANRDAPVHSTTILLADADGLGEWILDGATAWIPSYERLDLSTFDARYYLQELDLSDSEAPVLGARLNVPGTAIDVDAGRAICLDQRRVGTQIVASLAEVRLASEVAEFRRRRSLDGRSGWAAVAESIVILESDCVGDCPVPGEEPVDARLSLGQSSRGLRLDIQVSVPREDLGLFDVGEDRVLIDGVGGGLLYSHRGALLEAYSSIDLATDSVLADDGVWVAAGWDGTRRLEPVTNDD